MTEPSRIYERYSQGWSVVAYDNGCVEAHTEPGVLPKDAISMAASIMMAAQDALAVLRAKEIAENGG